MKWRFAWLLLFLAALVARDAAASVDINYTLTGLTEWKGYNIFPPEFDPKPDQPFQLAVNLNDADPVQINPGDVSFDDFTDSGSANFAGVGGSLIGDQYDFLDPRVNLGNDFTADWGDPLMGAFVFRLSGPALYSDKAGKLNFLTGRFTLTGDLGIFYQLLDGEQPSVETPLGDLTLTAQPVVPEGHSWVLVASCMAGLGGAYGVRRRQRLRLATV